MPRHYKAITDHVPIDYHAHLNRIDVYFSWKHADVMALFQRWKLRELEFDDCAALIAALKRRMTDFALVCNALPLRTPRQLMPTVKAIARDPQSFLEDPGTYDPEAAARVYGVYAALSPEHYAELEKFEWGTGPAPPGEGIAAAAFKVLQGLEADMQEESQVGGQTLELQREFVLDLAKLFLSFGGRIARITRYDPDRRPQYFETGPFHEFLKIVVPAARPFARRAGFRMNSIRSLVSIYFESQEQAGS